MFDPADGERLWFSDAEVVVKASADTTGGAFCIIEEIAPLDTPLHVHEHEDELFYVLEGEHVFQVGKEEFHAGPATRVRATRGPPRATTCRAAHGAHSCPLLSGGIRGLRPRACRGGALRHDRAGGICERLREVRDHLARVATRAVHPVRYSRSASEGSTAFGFMPT